MDRGRFSASRIIAWYLEYLPFVFLAFRFVYIPASVLSHSGHGWVWINATAGLIVCFGGEWLARRTERPTVSPLRETLVVLLALIVLGFYPEEGPLSLILWAGTGLAWGRLTGDSPIRPDTSIHLLAVLLGGLVGMTGLVGPGSWLMVTLLLPLLWQRNESA